MSKTAIFGYVILAVVIAIVLTFLTFATPLGIVLQYTSLAFIASILTQGMSGEGPAILIIWLTGFVGNFLWGLVPLFLAYKKSQKTSHVKKPMILKANQSAMHKMTKQRNQG